jgi:hypothetical protein
LHDTPSPRKVVGAKLGLPGNSARPARANKGRRFVVQSHLRQKKDKAAGQAFD